MIHFCLTNNKDITNISYYTNTIELTNDFVLYYNDGVTVYEDDKYVQLFCGILWNYTSIDLLYSDVQADELYNGQFYCVQYNKITSTIRCITDFKEDFPIYYHINDNVVITSRMLSFKYGYFTVNKPFVYDNLGHIDQSYTVNIATPLLIDNMMYRPTIIIKNVLCIGTSGILDINLLDHTHALTYYYNLYNTAINSFNTPYRLNSSEFKDQVHNIMTRNIKKIVHEYSNIVACSSNGSDSLLLLTYLQKHSENFNVIGYHDSTLPIDSSFTDNISKLFMHFPNSKLIDEDCNDNFQSINDMKSYCPTPTNYISQQHQCSILKKYTNITDTILMGNHGDHVFWHDPMIMLLYYYYNTPYKTFNKISEHTKDYYSHQKFRFDANADIINKLDSTSFNEVISEQLHYKFTYGQHDRNFSNRMIISPYTDIKLSTLLTECDLETQHDNITNIKTQRELINPTLLPYLNNKKEGGEAHHPDCRTKAFMKLSLLTVQYFIDIWQSESSA